jgi:hypothetical protein
MIYVSVYIAHLWQECHNSKCMHFLVTGMEGNVCRCTFNRYSVITEFTKLAAGEQLCRRYTHRKLQHFKTFKIYSCKITNFELWQCCDIAVTLLLLHCCDSFVKLLLWHSCDIVVANERYVEFNLWVIPKMHSVEDRYFQNTLNVKAAHFWEPLSNFLQIKRRKSRDNVGVIVTAIKVLYSIILYWGIILEFKSIVLPKFIPTFCSSFVFTALHPHAKTFNLLKPSSIFTYHQA